LRPHAASHDDLDADLDLQEDVRNAIIAAVKRRNSGARADGAQLRRVVAEYKHTVELRF
jgi:hypothetical protein